MSLETEIADLHASNFLREFSFASNKFAPPGGSELELADGIVRVGDDAIFVQMKQRERPDFVSQEVEDKWFVKKVLGTATKQIRDTNRYLAEHPTISVVNVHGDAFSIEGAKLRRRHWVICYRRHPDADATRWPKAHESETVGVIHVFSEEDYRFIVDSLVTFAEVSDYLDARALVLRRWPAESVLVTERALLGQYVAQKFDEAPSPRHADALAEYDMGRSEWDLRGVLEKFRARIDPGTTRGATEYYSVIEPIAQLSRLELREFRTRFDLAISLAKSGRGGGPWAMASTGDTACGFMFVALEAGAKDAERTAIAYTGILKYGLRLSRCVGVVVVSTGSDMFDVRWCFYGGEWVANPAMDAGLPEHWPFGDLRPTLNYRYPRR